MCRPLLLIPDRVKSDIEWVFDRTFRSPARMRKYTAFAYCVIVAI